MTTSPKSPTRFFKEYSSSTSQDNKSLSSSSVFLLVPSSPGLSDSIREAPLTKRNKEFNYEGAGWTLNKLRYSNLDVHGRKQEIEILQKCLQQICDDTSTTVVAIETNHPSTSSSPPMNEFVLIGGFSGTGKTTLAETLRKPVKRKGGLLVKGKFEFELRSSQPHAGIIQICRDISTYISNLKDSNSTLYQDISEAIWKLLEDTDKRFRSEVLSECIPDIDLFLENYEREEIKEGTIGRDNISQVTLNQSEEFKADDKNRLYYTIKHFLGIISSLCSPLVILLDDLQWADVGSLELLELVLKGNQEHQNPLMIVGCYRSNEVEKEHTFSNVLQDLRVASQGIDKSFNMIEIPLGNLQVSDVNNVLMDLLGIDEEGKTLGLAEICHRRTDGNVFFLISFVSMLHEEGLLEYNFGLMRWVWEDSVIEKQTVATTNVVDMIGKQMLTHLQDDLSEILKLASFLGASFKERLVDVLWEDIFWNRLSNAKTARSSKDLLQDAVNQLFLEQIQRSNGSYMYRWVHDKIQEAALSLVHPDEIGDLKYQCGRVLMERLTHEEQQESIFIICSLLNDGSIPDDRLIRIRVSELNLQASRKAIKASAFEIAAMFAVKGIKMLPKDSWVEYDELSLELYSTAAVVENISGQIDQARQHAKVVIEQKNCPIKDKLQVYLALVDSFKETDGAPAAMKLCLDVLRQLGCRFPKNTILILFATIRGILRAQKASKHINVESVLKMDFSPMDYKDMQLKLLDKAGVLCFHVASSLIGLVFLRSFNLATTKGFCSYSPLAYIHISVLMIIWLSDFEAGAKYADVGMELVNVMKLHRVESRCLLLVNMMTYHWTRPFASSLKGLVRAYEVGLQSGDTESALFSYFIYACHGIALGRPLASVVEDFAYLTKQARDLKKLDFTFIIVPYHQMVLNLLGRSNNTIILTGDQMDEDEYITKCRETVSNYGEMMRFAKTFACVYFGEYESGVKLAIERGNEVLKKVPGGWIIAVDPFYRALLFVVMAREKKRKRRQYKREARKLFKIIKTWVHKGNPNIVHQKLLIKAELASLDGQTKIANDYFYKASVRASRLGVLHEAALTNERFGHFLLCDMKDKEAAKFRFEESIRLYSEWGAMNKVKVLQSFCRENGL